LKLVSWNIARKDEAWRWLLQSDADLALLQEAAAPPADVAPRVEVNPAPWETDGAGAHRPWRTAVVRLSDRVDVRWLETKSVADAVSGELAVSRPGTLAAAVVTRRDGEPFVAVSMYGLWENQHAEAEGRWIFADGSVHRLISDLSAFVGQAKGHRILAAGDLNIYHGYGEHGSGYWASRYETVFLRMAALGLPFVGPQAPGGRRAEPQPREVPLDSGNVPTYHTNRQSPATAAHQLDFVFASTDLVERVHVHARNGVECWGPSDHCRVEIEVA
jgi:hypothetical protein